MLLLTTFCVVRLLQIVDFSPGFNRSDVGRLQGVTLLLPICYTLSAAAQPPRLFCQVYCDNNKIVLSAGRILNPMLLRFHYMLNEIAERSLLKRPWFSGAKLLLIC